MDHYLNVFWHSNVVQFHDKTEAEVRCCTVFEQGFKRNYMCACNLAITTVMQCAHLLQNPADNNADSNSDSLQTQTLASKIERSSKVTLLADKCCCCNMYGDNVKINRDAGK